MREILFRGKRKDNDEWFVGFYGKSGEKVYIIYDNDIAIGYVSMKEVIPETVGQYTNVIDKNGVNMCEGDIVAGALHWLEQKKNSIVTFRDGSFGLLWYRSEAEQFNPFTSMCNITYEVIGNIHDNPELLKGSD